MKKPCAAAVLAMGSLLGCGAPLATPQAPSASAHVSVVVDAPSPPPAEPARESAQPPGTPGGARLLRYRCDRGIAFAVRFDNDTAVLDAEPGGREVLLRDAGGATPQQTVFSNARMRVEFGLGSSGREAILRHAQPPVSAHCVQE